jgi:hypothetical protein
MTITTLANSLKNQLNGGNINELQDILRFLKLGNVLRAEAANLYGAIPVLAGVNPYVLATAQSIILPDDAKAGAIIYATARAGTGAIGALTPAVQANSAPGAAGIKVAPNGDLLLLGTDAYTLIDITYLPDIYDLFEFILPVVPGTGVLTLPPGLYATNLLEAEALAGTTVGKKIVLMPGTAQTTVSASINAAGTQVQFGTADAVTSARVKLGVKPAVDMNVVLEAAGGYLG